jgi:hypothetical protein
MDFGPPERPNDHLIAEKNAINFLKFLLKGIVVDLVTDKEQRYTPFVFVVCLFDL